MEKEELVKSLEEYARNIRVHSVKVAAHKHEHGELDGGGFHIGGALSAADILAALYFHFLKIDPKNPQWDERDRLILSKGHIADALYYALAVRGFISMDELWTTHRFGSRLSTHPSMKIPGVDLATGSLGHGLSAGVGMAIGAKTDGAQYNIYAVLGDGECDEGSIWEAAMAAAHYKLDNLIAIVDYNRLQNADFTDHVMSLEPFVEKWKAFRWSAKAINGNNMKEVVEAFESVPFEKGKPSALIANTVKGKGVSFIEGKPLSHYCEFTEKQLQDALDELGENKG